MGLFEVVRWKRGLTANVRLSCDVNSMAMPARFEGTRMGAYQVGFIPHWRITSASELAQWQVAVALSLSCTHTHPQIHSHTHKHTHFLSHPLSSSAFLSFTLFYISVKSTFPLCSSCQLSFHALPQKCVQVNISRLLMLKGSGSGRYVTGRELSVPRAAIDEPSPSSFHAAFIFKIMNVCDWREAFDDTFVLFIKMPREDTPSKGKKQSNTAHDCNVNDLC